MGHDMARSEEEDAQGEKGKASAAVQPQFRLVKFVWPYSTRDELVAAERWRVELPSGEVQAVCQQACFAGFVTMTVND